MILCSTVSVLLLSCQQMPEQTQLFTVPQRSVPSHFLSRHSVSFTLLSHMVSRPDSQIWYYLEKWLCLPISHRSFSSIWLYLLVIIYQSINVNQFVFFCFVLNQFVLMYEDNCFITFLHKISHIWLKFHILHRKVKSNSLRYNYHTSLFSSWKVRFSRLITCTD